MPEPQRVEADRDNHPIEGDALAFLLVVHLDDDVGLDRVQADDAAGDRADRLGPVAHVLHLDVPLEEADAAIGDAELVVGAVEAWLGRRG